jgi:MFS family permease
VFNLPSTTIAQRSLARRQACYNGLVWAFGNGLCSSALVIYLAFELNAPRVGLGIAFIRAAPHLAGLLRLGAPALIGRLADRKSFCIACYVASAAVLCALPLLARPGGFLSSGQALSLLVVLWCVYHLLQYLADVALWSWIADAAPQRIRGRFLGRRERWMLCGTIPGVLVSGLFSYYWKKSVFPGEVSLHWVGYAIPAELGACLMMLAVAYLVSMPALLGGPRQQRGLSLRQLAAPLADSRFLRLLAFGCWFSCFNGLFVAVHDFYPTKVLGVELLTILLLGASLRGGQMLLSSWVGRLTDRLGNRPVMMASLALVAAAPLFYMIAQPSRPWWFVGAWVLWTAYVGINVGQPALMLKLSPREGNAPYIAMFHAVTGVCMALSAILGGWLFDRWRGTPVAIPGTDIVLDFFQVAFFLAWILRSAGVLVLFWVPEPTSGRTRDARL